MSGKITTDKVFGEILQLKLARKYIPVPLFAERANLELDVLNKILNGSEKATKHILFKDLDILLGCTPGHFNDVYENITKGSLSHVVLKSPSLNNQYHKPNKDLPPISNEVAIGVLLNIPTMRNHKPVESEESVLVPVGLLRGLADAAHEGGYPIAGNAYYLIEKHKLEGKQ